MRAMRQGRPVAPLVAAHEINSVDRPYASYVYLQRGRQQGPLTRALLTTVQSGAIRLPLKDRTFKAFKINATVSAHRYGYRLAAVDNGDGTVTAWLMRPTDTR